MRMVASRLLSYSWWHLRGNVGTAAQVPLPFRRWALFFVRYLADLARSLSPSYAPANLGSQAPAHSSPLSHSLSPILPQALAHCQTQTRFRIPAHCCI